MKAKLGRINAMEPRSGNILPNPPSGGEGGQYTFVTVQKLQAQSEPIVFLKFCWNAFSQ